VIRARGLEQEELGPGGEGRRALIGVAALENALDQLPERCSRGFLSEDDVEAA
jgi:hypothetical protein